MHRGRRARAKTHLILVRPDADALHVFRDDEAGHLAASTFFVGLREDREEVGDAPGRDPQLVPVEHPVVAVTHRGRGDRRRIRTSARFRQAVRRDHLACRELFVVALLLVVRSKEQQPPHPDRAVRPNRNRHRGVVLRHLLKRARVGHVPEPHAPLVLGDDESEHPELFQLVDELERHLAGVVPLEEVFLARAKQALQRTPNVTERLFFGLGDVRKGEDDVFLNLAHAEGSHEAGSVFVRHVVLLFRRLQSCTAKPHPSMVALRRV